LNLDGNQIGDEGFTALSTCLDKIEKLEIRSKDADDLTMKGIKGLAAAIGRLEEPVSDCPSKTLQNIAKFYLPYY